MNRTFKENEARGCIKQFRFAALSEDFGMELFKKKAGAFADSILAELGTYSRGKRKGKQKGFIHWVKVVEGGFDYGDTNTVLRRGSFDYRVAKEFGVQHHECEYLLNFDDQRKSLSVQLTETQQKIEEITVEIPKLERQLQRAVEKQSEDVWGDSLVKASKETLANALSDIDSLNRRVVVITNKIDALDKGVIYKPE